MTDNEFEIEFNKWAEEFKDIFKPNEDEAVGQGECTCGGCRAERLTMSLRARDEISEVEKTFLLEISDAIRVFVAMGTETMKELAKELSAARNKGK